jgi:L-threonine kinase
MKGLTGWARCPGTCGEWVQGAKDGIPFLIGCPVNRFVEARVEIQPFDQKPNEHVQTSEPWGWKWNLPEGKVKTLLALEKFIKKNNFPPFEGQVELTSELPIGKGMASSTADMIAAMVAVAYSLGLQWKPEELARLVVEVEPSDPVMFKGITEFAHCDGIYVKSLGEIIPAQLLMIDWGGSLDTQCFNTRYDLSLHYRKTEPEIRKALSLFYEGIKERDLEKIAQAGTRSARCNQEINPKREFVDFLSWVKHSGGYGVIAAHSGTLLAGVFPWNLPSSLRTMIQDEARIRFRAETVEWLETYGGGIRGGVEHARWESVRSHGEVRKALVY